MISVVLEIFLNLRLMVRPYLHELVVGSYPLEVAASALAKLASNAVTSVPSRYLLSPDYGILFVEDVTVPRRRSSSSQCPVYPVLYTTLPERASM
jgi:hypothetical protein